MCVTESLKVGQVSDDSTAIVCRDKSLDLYHGSNHYYLQYFKRKDFNGSAIARKIALWNEYAQYWQVKGLFVVVPNKASCRPETYPLYRPLLVTQQLDWLKKVPWGAHQVSESHSLLDLTGMLQLRHHWIAEDSHLSGFGMKIVASVVAKKLEVDIPDGHLAVNVAYFGDLAAHFFNEPQPLMRNDIRSVSSMQIEFERSPQSDDIQLRGRKAMVRGQGPKGTRLLLVGDSNSFDAQQTSSLSHWLSSSFEEIHVHWEDDLEKFSDLSPYTHAVFQTTERFLANWGQPLQEWTII